MYLELVHEGRWMSLVLSNIRGEESHHSTLAASKKVRVVVKAIFTDAFAFLPVGRNDELMILDVGCGLGF